MKKKIVIGVVDYGSSNILSIITALDILKAKVIMINNYKDLNGQHYDKILFPGVGSFGNCIKILKKNGLYLELQSSLDQGMPYLGICLGMQVLFDKSDESINTNGLKSLKGKVEKLKNFKIPQIGWNQVNILTRNNLFMGITNLSFFYFLHSYVVRPKTNRIVIGNSHYGLNFPSVINHKNIYGVQFHPEKSGSCGLKLIYNWLYNC